MPWMSACLPHCPLRWWAWIAPYRPQLACWAGRLAEHCHQRSWLSPVWAEQYHWPRCSHHTPRATSLRWPRTWLLCFQGLTLRGQPLPAVGFECWCWHAGSWHSWRWWEHAVGLWSGLGIWSLNLPLFSIFKKDQSWSNHSRWSFKKIDRVRIDPVNL